MSKKITIVGGHGKVAVLLAKYLVARGFEVASTIRNPAQSAEITALGATPIVLNLVSDSVARFAEAFKRAYVVYFAAGGGAGGNQEVVDYKGAVKTYDAIEAVEGPKPRLILISGIDVRVGDTYPAHYDETDKAKSVEVRAWIGNWYKWKLEADKELLRRTAFKWTILRPGLLVDQKGTGKAAIGRTHVSPSITREDVALALGLLADREDADRLAIDFVGGDEDIAQGLDRFIKKGETDFPLV